MKDEEFSGSILLPRTVPVGGMGIAMLWERSDRDFAQQVLAIVTNLFQALAPVQ